jgi:hypothetical protein
MKPQMEYPEKTYSTKSGILTSSDMALLQQIGINKISEQLKTATGERKIKTLKNRLREIKLWLLMHPDVKQYMK